jgi:hypothetical protein
MNNKKKLFLIHETQKKFDQQGLQVLFHIGMAKFPIPEKCSAYVPMILKEFKQTLILSNISVMS